MISASYTVPYDSDVKSDVCYATDFERKLFNFAVLHITYVDILKKIYLYVGLKFCGPSKTGTHGPKSGPLKNCVGPQKFA